ncbi:MAG: SRPBCC domain-containing protein, partial [Chloroflexota bacterium]|nr:SRPBCC domain-containing protein [Chloroflexota bacterium]
MIGQTKTAGFQVGVRRTFPISVEQAWDFLTSEEGQRIWLGEACSFPLTKGATYTTSNGAKGVVRVINPKVNLRLTWQPKEWANASTIQIRTIPSGIHTVISFHQEGLPGARERASMRHRW